MTQPKRVGLSLNPLAYGEGILEDLLWAEEAGYESLWIRDGGGRTDGFTLAAAVAARTKRVRIALGVVPVFTRPPAVFATSAATLSHLAPGRIVLGVGSSSHAMIEGWYGTPFVKPKTRVKETVTLLRKMLAGEKTDYQGDTLYSKNFRLTIPVNGTVPIYLAALRPGMLELAGEIGDGVVLNLAHPKALPRMLEHIDAGAKRSGRRVEDLEIAMLLNTYVTQDPKAALRAFSVVAASYYSTPVYNEFLAWCGFEKEAAMITEGFKTKDRSKSLGALPDHVLNEFAAIGDAAQCRAVVRQFQAAGVTTPIVVSSSIDKGEHDATIRAFTPAAMAGA